MNLFQYYAVDWLAMVLTLLAIWMIGNRDRNGFIVHIAGNVSWIVMGFMAGSMATMLANFAFILENIRALVLWRKTENHVNT